MSFLRKFLGGETHSQVQPLSALWYDVPRSGGVDVAGTQHHLANLNRLFHAGADAFWEDRSANLVREPGNRYDPNAVAVLIEGRLVGYMPAEYAPDWSRYLAALEQRGYAARVTVEVWCKWNRREYDTPRYHLTMHVREHADYLMPEVLAAQAAELERAAAEKAAQKGRA